MEGVERATISEVTQEHQRDLQTYILKDVKELPTENEGRDMNRAGAYGNLIDLEWNGAHLAGKVLHSIFFAPRTEPSAIRKILTRFFEEIKLLSQMKHANIVEFRGIYYRKDSLLPVLVMEKMECDLDQYLTTHKNGSIPEDRALGILLDVSKGLVYLHEEIKVAHRDLSSRNILLTTKLNAKIADLGSARVLDRPGGWDSHVQLTVQPGTMDFMPPEALEDPPKYTVSVDVFSFGCVTIHLCTHKWPTPIGKTDQGKIISEFGRRQKYISEKSCSYLRPFIEQCLEEQSAKRPTSRYIMSLLEAKIEENARKLCYCACVLQIGRVFKYRRASQKANTPEFLKLLLSMCVCVYVCVCLPPRLLKTIQA